MKKIWYLPVIAVFLLTVSAPVSVSAVEKGNSLSDISEPEIVSDADSDSGKKVVWKCVWFGSYPQSEVPVKSELYQKLLKEKNWSSDGNITKNGIRYHRMKKEQAFLVSSGKNYYTWSGKYVWHFFIYEPIKWRVLSVKNDQAYLLSERILDCRPVNIKTAGASDTVSWASSTLRSWLNGYGKKANTAGVSYQSSNFREAAFSGAEQALISGTSRKNETAAADNSGGLDVKKEGTVSDLIFLPVLSEFSGTEGEKKGFFKGTTGKISSAEATVTDYARACGVWSQKISSSRLGPWWLASGTGDEGNMCWVDSSGTMNSSGIPSSMAGIGVRPAVTLNVSASGNYIYAGTLSSDGSVNEPEKQTSEIFCSKTSYSVSPDKGNFSLNAVLLHGDGELSYVSDNPKTAAVSSSGKVSIKGYGKANILIHASETSFFRAADKTVQIQVVPGKRKITAVKSPSQQKLVVTWKTNSKDSGYQMQISRTADFSQGTFERFYTKGTKKAVLTGLQPDNVYYVRIRAYRREKKVVLYGKWSKTGSARIR